VAQTNEMPSPMQETPSSTVEALPQDQGDFASWLSDRLDKFQKGEETPPWEGGESKEEPEKKEAAEKEDPTESEAEEAEGEASAEKADDEAGEEEDKEESEDEKEEAEDDTKNMSASAGAKFKELKTELKTYKAKVAELEKAVEEAKAAPAKDGELEALSAKLEKYEKEIAVARVEASPQYVKGVLEPTQIILDAAAGLAEKYKVSMGQLTNALREESAGENSDALTELAGDFSERDRVRLYRMADDLSEIARRRDFLRNNAAEAKAEMEKKQAAEEREAFLRSQQELKQKFEETWEDTFKDKDFVKSLDKKVINEIQEFANTTDHSKVSVEERAYAAYAGLLLPHMVEKLQKLEEQTAEYQKALSKYKKASPKVSGGTDTTVSNPEPGGFLDAVEKRFGG
jgi:hypothetical protein